MTRAAAFFVAGAMTVLFAQTPAPPPATLAGEKVRVTLRTFDTAAAAGTKDAGSVGMVAAPGESLALAVGAGNFDRNGRAEPGFCDGFAMGALGTDAVVRLAPHVWVANVVVRDVRMDGIDLAIRWEHYDSFERGHPVRVRNDSTVVTLEEGDRRLIDFKDVGDSALDCPRSVLVQLEAEVVENPSLADQRIGLDAWLLDDSDDGSQQVRRLPLKVRQGGLVEFRFPALTWPVNEFRFDDGTAAEVWAGISGSARARARPDGTFEIALEADRRLGVRPSGAHGPASLVDGGKKVFRVVAGETVRLVLPSPSGSGTIGRDGQSGSVAQSVPASTRPSARGVTVAADELDIRFGSFLASHRMSLLLTTHDGH